MGFSTMGLKYFGAFLFCLTLKTRLGKPHSYSAQPFFSLELLMELIARLLHAYGIEMGVVGCKRI